MAEIIFTGALGADSELRFTKESAQPVLNFRVGDSKSRKDDQGNWVKISENWFNVSLWGASAEFFAEHLHKGTRVKVYGEFYQREYDGRNGPGISLDVRASAIEVIPRREQNQSPPPANDGWGS